jgi:hypothetical protein
MERGGDERAERELRFMPMLMPMPDEAEVG